MNIYSATSLDPELSLICERALVNQDFTTHVMQPGGNQIISFPEEKPSHVAVLGIENMEGEGVALLISAVHPIGAEGLDAIIADLQAG